MPVEAERCQRAFLKAERDLLKLASTQDLLRVHRFRTSTLRLQSLLEYVVPGETRTSRKLLKTLASIRKRAGRVRDVDVQLAALRSLKVPQAPRRKTQLIQELLALREKHERKLLKFLTNGAVKAARKRIRKAAKEFELKSAAEPLEVARKMLATAMPDGGVPDEAGLHQCRLTIKRARYVAEFAKKSAPAERLIAELKQLQDALGNWNDWQILTDTAAKRLGDITQSPLVATLNSVTRTKFRHAIAALSAYRHPRIAPQPQQLPAKGPGTTIAAVHAESAA